MDRGLLRELNLARRQFAILATLLLVLPLLFSLAPRPSEATATYIASLTGYDLCSQTGVAQQGERQVPQNPCQYCIAGSMCPVIDTATPLVAVFLTPQRVLSGALPVSRGHLQVRAFVGENGARGPPFFI
jgi:hypothetical protein